PPLSSGLPAAAVLHFARLPRFLPPPPPPGRPDPLPAPAPGAARLLPDPRHAHRARTPDPAARHRDPDLRRPRPLHRPRPPRPLDLPHLAVRVGDRRGDLRDAVPLVPRGRTAAVRGLAGGVGPHEHAGAVTVLERLLP